MGDINRTRAFPLRGSASTLQYGMELRDYFAAHAPEVPAWWRANPMDETINLALWRFEYADAMMKAREKGRE